MAKMKIMFVLLLATVMLSACGGGNNAASGGNGAATPPAKGNEPAPQKQEEPVKLVLYDAFNADTEDYTNTMYVNPVKKKYPYITVEVVQPKVKKLEDIIVTGDQIDLIVDNVIRTNQVEELGLNVDMGAMAKQNNFDLKRLEQPTLNMIQSFNSTKKLIGIPYKGGFMALYYNKDIFDKFGVPYPKDDMTWDQVIDLAKKLTRQQDGNQYIGFNTSLPYIASSLTNNFVDAKTGKANLSTPEWKQGYEVFSQLQAIQGNKDVGLPAFSKDQNAAMMTSQNTLITLKDAKGLNWDLVTFPKFAGKPIQGAGSARGMFITSTGKHQDAAFKVIESTTSDEAQVILAGQCGMPEVKSPSTQSGLCSAFPEMKGKNYAATFKFTPKWPENPTEYDQPANTIVGKHADDLAKGTDINTVIRQTEEEINQKIEELRKK
ncbi:MAG: extracellular solute-binding protein family 1 [Paenibacillaceae bacterium]|jgi:multiple sugar transport system substrate-binding protein|nr:extracellular solute-binding protein family 1 [Paenibacillaceae bacterium]